jgi:hypothetical protein
LFGGVAVGDFVAVVVCFDLVGVVSVEFGFDSGFVYDFDFVFGGSVKVERVQYAANSHPGDFVSGEAVGPVDLLLVVQKQTLAARFHQKENAGMPDRHSRRLSHLLLPSSSVLLRVR